MNTCTHIRKHLKPATNTCVVAQAQAWQAKFCACIIQTYAARGLTNARKCLYPHTDNTPLAENTSYLIPQQTALGRTNLINSRRKIHQKSPNWICTTHRNNTTQHATTYCLAQKTGHKSHKSLKIENSEANPYNSSAHECPSPIRIVCFSAKRSGSHTWVVHSAWVFCL